MAMKSGTWYVLAVLFVPAVLALLFLIFSGVVSYDQWQEKKSLYQPEAWEGLEQLRTQEKVQAWHTNNLPEAKFLPSSELKGFDLITLPGTYGNAQIHFRYANPEQENPEIQEIITSYTGYATGLLNEWKTVYKYDEDS